MQAAIKKQLGLVAHREVRDADVLVLVVSDPALIGMAVASGGNGLGLRRWGRADSSL